MNTWARQAFTLIKLLVIIAFLAALLLPALAKTHYSGKRAAFLNNISL